MRKVPQIHAFINQTLTLTWISCVTLEESNWQPLSMATPQSSQSSGNQNLNQHTIDRTDFDRWATAVRAQMLNSLRKKERSASNRTDTELEF
jgi:hypothetical protein